VASQNGVTTMPTLDPPLRDDTFAALDAALKAYDKAMVAYDKLSDEIRRTGGCDPMKLMRLSSRAEGARVALIAAARAHVAAGDAGRELEAVKAKVAIAEDALSACNWGRDSWPIMAWCHRHGLSWEEDRGFRTNTPRGTHFTVDY